MDMQKTAREIGLFESSINLSKVCTSADVLQKVGASMPLPDENIVEKISDIAAWLYSFGKRKYMFLTPEIALIEEMAKISKRAEAIIAVPCDLDMDAKERLRNNCPRDIEVTILEEPFFPQSFLPENGMLIVCGYSAGGRPMVLYDTYRMAEHYSGFYGKKVFVPFVELDTAVRYDGWYEIGQNKLNTMWRSET